MFTSGALIVGACGALAGAAILGRYSKEWEQEKQQMTKADRALLDSITVETMPDVNMFAARLDSITTEIESDSWTSDKRKASLFRISLPELTKELADVQPDLKVENTQDVLSRSYVTVSAIVNGKSYPLRKMPYGPTQ